MQQQKSVQNTISINNLTSLVKMKTVMNTSSLGIVNDLIIALYERPETRFSITSKLLINTQLTIYQITQSLKALS